MFKLIRKGAKSLTAMILIFSIATTVFAAAPTDPSNPDKPGGPNGGPRRQLATIVFCGLGGAVLGLSTLSFYGRPQDYLPNIAIGMALGIIFGTVFATFKAATQPQEFYGLPPPGSGPMPPPGSTYNPNTIMDRELASSQNVLTPTLMFQTTF